MVSMSDTPKERNILKLILVVRFACATFDVGHPIEGNSGYWLNGRHISHANYPPHEWREQKKFRETDSLRYTNPVLLGLVDLLSHTSTCR
jgi:hypothetical protein